MKLPLRSFRRPRVLGKLAFALVLCWSGLSHAADPKASRYYEDALERYEKKDIPGAIIQLKNALQIDNSMLPVQVLLGKALLHEGEVVAAEVALNEALRLGVSRAEVIIPLAQAVIAQGKQKQLFETQQFELAGLPNPVQIQLHLLRAAASSDLGDMRSAMKSVEEARVLDTKSPGSWLAEVPLRIRMRQFREALEAADRALALAPNSAEAIYQKGSVLHVQGDLRGAADTYSKALQANPEHIEARIARAGLAIDFKQLSDAQKDLTEIQRLAPSEPRAAYFQAMLAEARNDQPAARAALREITDLIDPVPMDYIRYRPQSLMLNGLAHFSLNEREKAKPYLEAYQRTQGSAAVSKLLAQIYIGESNIARAIDVLESYLKVQPADSQALTLLASAHMAQGRHARAASLIQDALKTRDAPELRTALGLSLWKGGQFGNAITELESAYKRDPKQTRAGAALISLYLRGGQAAKAAAMAQTLVKQEPDNPTLFNLLGMSQGQLGKIPEAREAFERAVKLDDGLVAAKINLAKLDIASRAYDAAARRLESVLRAEEKNTEAMFEMAVIAGRRNLPADAQAWLEKANYVSGPRDLAPGLALVELHLRSGRAPLALEAAKRLVTKAPDDLRALMVLARTQLATADTAGAKKTLSDATRFAEFNAAMQVDIARMQLALGNLSGATYSLEKALSGQPDFLPAVALMAEVDLRQGDVAKAEKRAREVVASAPKRAIGYTLLGDAARARNQPAAAVEAYRQAHHAEPTTETLVRLFNALPTQDGGKAAQQLASDWIRQRPNDVTARKVLADSYARIGNFAAARTAYEGLLKTVPDDPEVLNNLANALMRLKDYPGAVKVAEQAYAKTPSSAVVIDTLGWALFQTGQTDRALQLLRDARLREPANAEIRFHLAVVLAQTGRKTEAREELDTAIKTGASREWIAEAKALAAKL